jgi:hypothetical protein
MRISIGSFSEIEMHVDFLRFESLGELEVFEDLIFDRFVASRFPVVVAVDEQDLSKEGALRRRGGGEGVDS